MYAVEAYYKYTEPWTLSWHFRKHLVISEILCHDADVLTLQEVFSQCFFSMVLKGIFMGSKKSHESFSIFDIVEVQAEHYTEWYVPQLKKAGYEGVFLQKSKVFFTSKYFHYSMYTYNLNLTKIVHVACPCCEYFQWNELVVSISNELIHPYARYTVEGCATFYRSDRFHLVEKHPVEYNFQHNVCN